MSGSVREELITEKSSSARIVAGVNPNGKQDSTGERDEKQADVMSNHATRQPLRIAKI
jgi:hypothetical protein